MAGNHRGINVRDGSVVHIENTVITGSQLNGLVSYGEVRWVDVSAKNSSITANLGTGIVSQGFSRVRISGMLVTGNDLGLSSSVGGAITSYSNNQVFGNTSGDGSPTATAGAM
jgi:hypothetical protein